MTSSELLLSFTVDQLKNWWLNIISVFNNKLLVSCSHLSQLFIYNCEGHHLSTITIDYNDELFDATWTPHGNIVYTTFNSNKVVVMSESGNVITTHMKLATPRYLSISNDDIIYLAVQETGVYQSTDDGINWTLVFKSVDEWHCEHVIKVTNDNSDDFWTLGMKDSNCHLCVYSLDRGRPNSNVTWKDINFTTTDNKQIDLYNSSLSYDGNNNIFLSDWDNNSGHVLLVNGQYHCEILSSHQITNKPYRFAVDKKRQFLYVGQLGGVVEKFKMIYGSHGD